MKKKNCLRKVLLLALTLCLLLGCAAAGAVAENAEQQKQGTKQIETNGGEINLLQTDGKPFDITMSKYVYPTGVENFFDIELKVKTHRHVQATATDVVVVMDISNTMNSEVAGTGNNKPTRLKAVKDAVKAFLADYAVDTNLATKRFGVVTFNTNATIVLPLTPVSSSAHATSIQNNYINNITAPADARVKFTNIEGGLRLAHNMLNESNATYKYIILLTDGFPTTYNQVRNSTSTISIAGFETYMTVTEGGEKKYNSSKNGTLGYFANPELQKSCWYGVDYSNKGALLAQEEAASIKEDDINIFSIGVALGNMSIADYLEDHKDKAFTTVDLTGMSAADLAADKYAIGKDAAGYRSWLETKIAGGDAFKPGDTKYLNGDDTDELEKDLHKILETIEIIPVAAAREFYTTDYIGEDVEFLHFYNQSSKNAGNSLSGQSKLDAEDTAAYTKSSDQFDWNLIQSGYKTETANGYDWFVYNVKYRVRLENEKTGYTSGNVVQTNNRTNKDTILAWDTHYADNSQGPKGTEEYPVPKVKGYKGSLQILKVDSENNTPIGNTSFMLSHDGTACDICKGAAVIADQTGMTANDGTLTFSDIPSGHDYTLTETAPADNYKPGPDYEVVVSYGQVYINGSSNPLTDPLTIQNDQKEPVELRITAGKQFDQSWAGGYELGMTGTIQNGTHYHHHLTTGDNGKVTFPTMVFNKAGTYELTIKEPVGTNPQIVYDANEVNIKIVVTANGATGWKVDVSLKKTGDADYTPVKSHAPTGADNDRYTDVDITADMGQWGGYTFTNSTRASASFAPWSTRTIMILRTRSSAF